MTVHNYNQQLATLSEVIFFCLGKPISPDNHKVTKEISMDM